MAGKCEWCRNLSDGSYCDGCVDFVKDLAEAKAAVNAVDAKDREFGAALYRAQMRAHEKLFGFGWTAKECFDFEGYRFTIVPDAEFKQAQAQDLATLRGQWRRWNFIDFFASMMVSKR